MGDLRESMQDPVWAVSKSAYLESVGRQRFMGLPQEEVDRLRGAVDVVAVGAQECEGHPDWLPLCTYTVVHYNYVWFTTTQPPRALGYRKWLSAEGSAPLFLGEALQRAAWDVVTERFSVAPPTHLRLAGLFNDGQYLALVYVARLPQRKIAPLHAEGENYGFCGNQELQMEKATFEPLGQTLIDHLACL